MLEFLADVARSSWELNWVWGIPLVVATVVFHVLCLGLIDRGVTVGLDSTPLGRPSLFRFVIVMGSVAFLATLIHAIEAAIWAFALLHLGAVESPGASMLYSLNALTSFGHDNIALDYPWTLLGAIEALNGIMLFGLTTAFLFAIMQRVWFLGRR